MDESITPDHEVIEREWMDESITHDHEVIERE